MDTLSAFAMGSAYRDKELRVFDWIKAAEILRDRKPQSAVAGLAQDMDWTAGTIWEDGAPVTDSYTYLASTWACPVLEIDGEEIDCFKMQSEVPTWGAETRWPDEALAIVSVKA